MIHPLIFTSVVLAALNAPYPQSTLIRGIEFDWSTHRRSAQGSDNFQLTWADDNHLYGAWGDGGGFGGTNRLGRVGLGVARIEGDADSHRGFNVWGGHQSENIAAFAGKSWGMISVDGTFFMWVVPDKPAGKKYRNHYEYVELARSRDHAASWEKATWRFEEAEDLTIPTFLNFSRDNSGVPKKLEEYVYCYFIRPQSRAMEQAGGNGVGLVVHKPGAIYLARVPKATIFQRKEDYQFFRGSTMATSRPGAVSRRRFRSFKTRTASVGA